MMMLLRANEGAAADDDEFDKVVDSDVKKFSLFNFQRHISKAHRKTLGPRYAPSWGWGWQYDWGGAVGDLDGNRGLVRDGNEGAVRDGIWNEGPGWGGNEGPVWDGNLNEGPGRRGNEGAVQQGKGN